jgi:amino acid transporter
MPHSGGYIVWVHNAFGPALALLNGMVNLLCNVFDCALYPLLLAQYVERALYPLLPPEPHGAHGASWWRELAPDVIGSCLRLAVVALAAGVNVLGTSVVGIGMVAFMFLVSPTLLALVLASYAAPHTAALAPFTPSLQEPPTSAAQWHFLLALVMWNDCGYVTAAAWSPPLAGDCSLRRSAPFTQVRLGGHGRLRGLGRSAYLP